MKRRAKNLIQLAVLAVLCLLVILSVFVQQISWPEKSERRLEISVIFREWDSGTWSETRRGMEKAAADYGAELRFLTVQQENSSAEQQRLMEQECKNGADGLIIIPANDTVIQKMAEDYPKVPYRTIESLGENQDVSAVLDNQKIGEMLAAAAKEDFTENATALLVEPLPGNSGIHQRIEAAETSLKQSGFSVLHCSKEQWAELIPQADFVILPETAAANELLDFLEEQQNKIPIYTAGYSQDVTVGLENGMVAAAVIWNGYGVGYQAVQQVAGDILEQEIAVSPIPVVLMRKEDMYEAENQKILFPIGN